MEYTEPNPILSPSINIPKSSIIVLNESVIIYIFAGNLKAEKQDGGTFCFKINTDFFTRSICYNIGMVIS